MKRKITTYLAALSLVALLSIAMSGCGAAAAVTPNCNTTSNYCNGKDLKTCCTSTSCYYKIDGTRYNCNGTNCFDAAERLVNEQCDFSAAGVEAEDLALEALKMSQEAEEL